MAQGFFSDRPEKQIGLQCFTASDRDFFLHDVCTGIEMLLSHSEDISPQVLAEGEMDVAAHD